MYSEYVFTNMSVSKNANPCTLYRGTASTAFWAKNGEFIPVLWSKEPLVALSCCFVSNSKNVLQPLSAWWTCSLACLLMQDQQHTLLIRGAITSNVSEQN